MARIATALCCKSVRLKNIGRWTQKIFPCRAGHAINYELDPDAAMMYFINREIYNMKYICSVLGNFSDVTNGLDCFAFQPDPDQKKPKRSKKKG